MHITPIKAIRLKCLDCCAGHPSEVRICTALKCPLYPYRMGKRPKENGDTQEVGTIENTQENPHIFTAEAKKENPLA